MYLFKLYFLKALKRLLLLSKFNFSLSRKLNGKKIYIPFINGTGLPNYTINKDFLDYLINAFVEECEGTFVDVGVNIGQSMLRVKTLMPDVDYLGFEPNATCVSYSQYLIKKNNFQNCHILNCALSTNIQLLKLNKTLTDDSRASLVDQLRPDFFIDKEDVLAIDYQSFFMNKKISFIKIDVEGAEYEALKGMEAAINKHQPIIVCEILDSFNDEILEFTQKRASQVYDLISSLDYRIIQLHKENQKIISYKKIHSFKIKQWTPDSYNFNDYLFYPTKQNDLVIEKLNRLT